VTPQQVWDRHINMPGQDMREYMPFLREVAYGNVLEIGVRGGVSTSAFLLGLDDKNDGHLWSIDIDAKCADVFEHPRWTFVHGDSTTVPLDFPPIDILLIDGCHLHPVVDSDINRFSALVKEGGLILMHDIIPPPHVTPQMIQEGWGTQDVPDAYFIFLEKTGYEHKELPGLFGLGVITKS
jgi:predicted O-methyltransferase YrrM